jgi:hypothetical protein
MMIPTTILNDVIMQNAECRKEKLDGRWSVVGRRWDNEIKKQKQTQTESKK